MVRVSRLGRRSSATVAEAEPLTEDTKEKAPICGQGVLRMFVKSPPRLRTGDTDRQGLLSPSSSGEVKANNNNSRGRKLNLYHRRVQYEDISDHRRAPSPSTESTCSGSEEKSPTSRREFFDENLDPSEPQVEPSPPSYILQFHPGPNEKDASGETEKIEIQPTPPPPPPPSAINNTRSAERQRQGKLKPGRVSQSAGKRHHTSVGWEASLPAVVEERSLDLDESGSAAEDDDKKLTSDSSKMLLAMRSLVLKQQAAIEEMTSENKKFREELTQYRQMLTDAHSENHVQSDEMQKLKAAKASSETEAMKLREEMKSLRAEMARVNEESQLQKPFFPRSNGPESPRGRAPDRPVSLSLSPRSLDMPSSQSFEPGTFGPGSPRSSQGTFAPSSPQGNPVGSPERQMIRPQESLSPRSPPGMEPMSEDHLQQQDYEYAREYARFKQQTAKTLPPPPGQDQQQRQDRSIRLRDSFGSRDSRDGTSSSVAGETGSVGGGSSSSSSGGSSLGSVRPPTSGRFEQSIAEASRLRSAEAVNHSSAARSKEEVTLFKHRLEAIQKKREQRKQRDGDVGSRSGRIQFT